MNIYFTALTGEGVQLEFSIRTPDKDIQKSDVNISDNMNTWRSLPFRRKMMVKRRPIKTS